MRRRTMKVFKAACIGVASTFVAGCGADTGGASADGAGAVDRAAQALPTDGQVCITVQRDAGTAGVADAVLWQNAPRWNDGVSPTLSTGTSAAGGNRRSLLRFDLSGVPSGASVVSASLSVSQLYKTIDSTVRVHRVTSAWEESAVTWSSLGEAFDPAIAASFTTGGGSGFRSSDITELARAWVSGEAENHGVLLEEDPVQRTEYHSSEKAQIDKRPRLDLCYVTCEDGIQNGDETNVDCGGASCAPCDTCAPVLFGDDFSDDAQGWTLGPEWQIGPAAASSGGAHGSDPAVDHTSSDDNGVAGVVLGGNASTALHGLYYLESPPFDTSGATGDVTLSFYRWLNSDYAPYMHNTVEVFDGASWVTLWASGGSPGVEDTSWTPVTHDLTPYRSATTRVRFGFDVTSGGAYTIGSWNIDDVYVTQACGDPVPSDAFPLDPAASVDTDGDGYPDAWDPGRTQADSTTGLVLDAFPLDSACQLPEHGLASDPSVCDVANGIPDYVPDQVMLGSDDVVYLFSQEHDRIFRWSLSADYHLNPIVLGASDALRAAYGAEDHRIYVAYQSGALTRIDLAAGVAEAPFATLPAQPHGLATAGSIVMAADPSGAWGTHYTFLPSGAGVSTVDWNYYSREYAWSPSTGRMYFFRDNTSPNDLHWESIDTTSGAITGEGESPYHGDFAIAPPIRPSADGSYVLLGSGDLYDGTTLEVVGSLPIAPSDAAWLPDGTLITLRADAGETVLEQWAERGQIFVMANVQRFSGEPVRVLSRPDAVVVITSEGARPVFSEYTPTDDGDGDGVPFADDAFPTDSAASVDTDGDGYPDAWNPGQTQADSTTGLVLDAFPLDSSCQLPEHGLAGDPGVCDVANGIPDYVPDQVMLGSDDVVYLFSQEHDRIFRWSLSADYHLNPIVLGASDALHAAYGADDHRIYVAYQSGALTRIDLAAGVAEAPFATLPAQPHGLATAGSIVMAADPSGAWGTHYTFLPSGTRVSAIDWNYQSPEYAWSAALGRMFYFSHWSPADLHWESIDTASGAITGHGESPYHGDFAITPPIRPSADGSYVLLGSGDLYDGTTLEVVGSLPIAPSDAAWLPDGTLITLRAEAGETVLEQWAERGQIFVMANVQRFSGEPVRVLSRPDAVVVITSEGARPVFSEYTPTDDGDGDGVPFADDAFPTDSAASVDTDGDGYPDAWNPGQTQADSTTGLVLDAFPLDSACQLPEHGLAGDPGVCDIANGIPDYVPDQVMLGSDDVVYLFSQEHDRIFRWSLSADYHLNPIVLGASDALRAAYGAEDHRIYVAYQSGALTRIDLAAGVAEAPFATLPAQPHGLATAGSIVMAADPSGAWGTHYTFLPSGAGVSTVDWNYYSREYVWSPSAGRMYFLRDDTSPNDLHWESIDTTSGAITGQGESPYHGDLAIAPPIRPSVDGGYVLLGSGDLYDGATLEVVASLPIAPSDAAWLPDGTLITLRSDAGETLLEQWAESGETFLLVNHERFSGEPIRILSRSTTAVVITDMGSQPTFAEYVPTDDGDGDGIPFADDAFPLDAAASVDTDGDGRPDAWNPGQTQADSATGLVLDAFPLDSACQLPEHGLASDPGVCDIASSIPDYVPDQVMLGSDDVVYLFSRAHDRIFRWSLSADYHLNPIVLGASDALHAAYGAEDHRIYVAYQSGALTRIDLAAGVAEAPFATLPAQPHGLATAGSIVMAADPAGAWGTHYTFLPNGTRVSAIDWNYQSPEYAWSAALGRMFYFSHWSPADLHWESIDTTSGAITGHGESPYHGDFPIVAPIRPSPDGSHVLLGSGNIYDGTTLNVVHSLPAPIRDAAWLSDGGLVTIRNAPGGTSTLLDHHGDGFALLGSQTIAGAPLRVLATPTETVLLTQGPRGPQFQTVVP
ncbi:DNRLRE domain-containing protein [Sorangium sp. So ce1667]